MTTPNISIDLDQLAIRESEQVEWKENVADINDVVATLSAFANDLPNLGGGYVVCGAAETKDEHGFPYLSRVGLSADRLKEIEGLVLTRCRDLVSPSISPLVQEIVLPQEDKRILIFIQPATGTAHTCRRSADGGKYYVRVSRETREARNGILKDLLVRKGVQEPWDRRICSGATVNDLDLLAIRDALQRMRVFSANVGVEPYLADDTQLSAFVPPLCVRETLTGQLRPRNFAMLLFGRDVQRFIPGVVSYFSIYPGSDRADPYAERFDLAGTILEQARRLHELLDVQSYTSFDKTNSSSPNTVKYPKRALYEAMGNALAHRDYELDDPLRITVFDDRIEVISPGSVPFGVDPIAFREGKAGPRWRNQTLAWFFNRLQIAQAEGQGIPTIFRTMREEGCPPPVFITEEARVTCTLPAHPRHAALRELREIEQDMALGDLPKAQRQALNVLVRDNHNVRGLQLLAEIQASLRDPTLISTLVEAEDFNIHALPSSLLVQLSEALMSGKERSDKFEAQARRLLEAASVERLEERELNRLVIALLRSRDEKSALSLIDRNLRVHPEWEQNASLSRLKADAFIGLAKRCRNTATRRRAPGASRERAWEQFHSYIGEAEKNLAKAESVNIDVGLDPLIRKNRTYLDELKRTHPNRRGRRPN